MTDRERAAALMTRWFMDDEAGDLAERIALEFDAVRQDERRTIVAWLDDQATFYPGPPKMGSEALADAADAIERGEHAGYGQAS